MTRLFNAFANAADNSLPKMDCRPVDRSLSRPHLDFDGGMGLERSGAAAASAFPAGDYALPSGLPYRQLARLGYEFRASFDALLVDMFPNRYAESILFLAVARACTSDWVGEAVVSAPDAPTLAITVNSIASSLVRPFETTRRHVTQFVEEGLFVRTKDGIALSTAPLYRDRIIAFYVTAHDLWIRYAEDIAKTCDLRFPTSTDRTFTIKDIINRALDTALMPLSGYFRLAEHWLALLIWVAIKTITSRPHVRRETNVRVSDAAPPAVSLNAVARVVRLPYATAWRHCRQLESNGMLIRTHQGWQTAPANGEIDRIERATVQYTLRRIRELCTRGLDLTHGNHSYLDERPPLIAM